MGDCYWKNYKIKLHNLTEEQKKRILDNSNLRRFVYNWALAFANEYFNTYKKAASFITICSEFTKFKKQKGYEWLDSANVTICRYAIKDLKNAFNMFFQNISPFPKYKSKKSDTIRFASRADRLYFHGENGRYAYIPGISDIKDRNNTMIDCGNHNIPIGDNIKYSNVRIKFDGIDYWLSLSVAMIEPIEYENPIINSEDNIIGIDVGIRTPATLSNGIIFDNTCIRRLEIFDHRKRILQRQISKDRLKRLKISASTKTKYSDIPKSKNQIKREQKYLKTLKKTVNTYRTMYHKISRDIVNMRPDAIVLEDLRIKELFDKKLKKLNDSIYQSRMGTLLHYIRYKAEENNIPIILAPRQYPSTQICSFCGNIHHPGKSKMYKCPYCGFEIDRDLNAAYNLRDFGQLVLGF